MRRFRAVSFALAAFAVALPDGIAQTEHQSSWDGDMSVVLRKTTSVNT
jgi:hypothetical protein